VAGDARAVSNHRHTITTESFPVSLRGATDEPRSLLQPGHQRGALHHPGRHHPHHLLAPLPAARLTLQGWSPSLSSL